MVVLWSSYYSLHGGIVETVKTPLRPLYVKLRYGKREKDHISICRQILLTGGRLAWYLQGGTWTDSAIFTYGRSLGMIIARRNMVRPRLSEHIPTGEHSAIFTGYRSGLPATFTWGGRRARHLPRNRPLKSANTAILWPFAIFTDSDKCWHATCYYTLVRRFF